MRDKTRVINSTELEQDTFNAELDKSIQTIICKRQEIIENFIAAWIAGNIPDHRLNRDFIFKNMELIETVSADRLTRHYSIRIKKEVLT